MIYSKGKCILKIIPKSYAYINKTPYYWIRDLQLSWNNHLEHKILSYTMDYNIMPYDNINKRMRLQSDNNGEIIVVNNRGGKCF